MSEISPPVCQSMVMKVYQSVIDHTIDSCYNLYSDDGLDKAILDELKHIWLNKLKQCPSLKLYPDKEEVPTTPAPVVEQYKDKSTFQRSTVTNISDHQHYTQQTTSSSMVIPLTRQSITSMPIMQQNRGIVTNIPTTMAMSQSQIPRINSNNVVLLTQQQQQRILAATSSASNHHSGPNTGQQTLLVSSATDPARPVAVQIMLPGNRIVHIQVPQIILSEKRLQGILTGTVIQATMGMTAVHAGNYLQQHINSSYQNQVRSMVLTRIINQLDGQFDSDSDNMSSLRLKKSKKEKKHKHKDPLQKRLQEQDDDLLFNCTEDDDFALSDGSSSDSDLSDDENEENNDSGSEGIIGIEEALNSGDDISEEECEDIFDTENVIVCQYEKVIRNRNKWRFTFKDGIMNIQGKDYVFNRTFGWGDW